ncbi:MAG TPA: hypothetical protein VND43_05875 [Burkholderiales bacterium]|nr:hypothetical protein [Burkholderiales bacterium]
MSIKKGLRLQLTALNSAIQPEDMDAHGWQFYSLKWDRENIYAI